MFVPFEIFATDAPDVVFTAARSDSGGVQGGEGVWSTERDLIGDCLWDDPFVDAVCWQR